MAWTVDLKEMVISMGKVLEGRKGIRQECMLLWSWCWWRWRSSESLLGKDSLVCAAFKGHSRLAGIGLLAWTDHRVDLWQIGRLLLSVNNH